MRRRGAGERLRLESELLALRSRLSEASAQLDRAHDDRTRAQADLEAERAARAADAEEFRASLEQIRATAEEAVTEGLGEVVALRTRVASLAGVADEAERLRERLTSIRDMLEDGAGAGGDAT